MMQKIQIANKQDPNLPQTVTMEGKNYLPIDCIDSNCKRFIKSTVTYTFKKGNYQQQSLCDKDLKTVGFKPLASVR